MLSFDLPLSWEGLIESPIGCQFDVLFFPMCRWPDPFSCELMPVLETRAFLPRGGRSLLRGVTKEMYSIHAFFRLGVAELSMSRVTRRSRLECGVRERLMSVQASGRSFSWVVLIRRVGF
jgi:hypothetical protein